MSPANGVRFLFVESNTSGTGRLFVQAAARLGFRPLLLAADASRYPFAREDAVEVRELDTSDPKALQAAAEAAQRDGGVAAVTSTSEYFVVAAARLARALGLPGQDPVALERCRDKGQQRAQLFAAGVGSPVSRPASSESEAVAVARELGLPVVVKPPLGSGSVGVKLCSTEAEVHEQAALLLAAKTNERGQPIPQRILVEELAVGPEFSVETFQGEIIGVTRKHLGAPPFFVEIGHDFPAELPPEHTAALGNETVRALRALGLGWGPAHTELRLTAKGPYIIEVNPRLAGGFIPELVRLATGIDLVEQTVLLSAGRPATPVRTAKDFASLRFLLPTGAGKLRAVHGQQELKQLPHVADVRVYSAPGSAVALRGDFRDRIGHVITRAGTATASSEAVAQALPRLRVELE